MEMDGGEGKSAFGGSNKRARTTAAGSEWAHSRVFSDEEAEGDVRTRAGAASAPGAALGKGKSLGVAPACVCTAVLLLVTKKCASWWASYLLQAEITLMSNLGGSFHW